MSEEYGIIHSLEQEIVMAITLCKKSLVTTTTNNIPYTTAWNTTTNPNGIYRMRCDPTIPIYFIEYDLIHWEQNLTPVNIVNLSAAGNDVHVIWKDNLGTNNGNNLRYKYYDDIPLVPQNLAVEIYTIENENHPKLTWTLNNEPDVYIKTDSYNIWRRIACIGDSRNLILLETPQIYLMKI